MLIGDKIWANVRYVKVVLILFEVISCLKVNFHKSLLVEVNVPNFWLVAASAVLNCKTRILPFSYLGLPICGDSRKLNCWYPLINRIKSRLSVWKSKNLSMAGYLILMKYVMSSPPVYLVFFFKAHAGIISYIKSIFNCFLWVGGGC